MTNFPIVHPLSDLIVGCLRNDRKSQEILYQQFFGYAMGISIRYVPTREKAIEVLNDSFLRVFTSISQYNFSKSFKEWLREIIIRTVIYHYQEELNNYNDNIEQVADLEFDETVDHLTYETLIFLSQKLPTVNRLVFNMYVIDKFVHEEIASQLGISIGASILNLAIAREKIRLLLKQINYNQYVRANR